MSALDPYLALIKEKYKEFRVWLKPNPENSLLLQIAKLALKIPLVLLAVLVSPLAIILLLFAFIAAF